MRGADNGRLVQSGDHVESAVVQRLFDDVVSQIAKRRGQKDRGVAFATGRRVDVDEPPRQLKLRQRIHASSPVRVSVRSSRYFTMTGVASESPQAPPAPDWTARSPGPTTAPPGTISGSPGSARTIALFGKS